MSSDPETPRPEHSTVHEAARHIAAVSSPDCRCTFKRGQLVKLCTLCEANAEVIERAMTEAIGTALLAFKARAEFAEQQLTAARLDAEEQLSLKNAHLVQANAVGRAQALAEFQERLTAKFTPALNTGTAMDSLALMGEVIREMSRLLHLPQEPTR